MIRTTTTISANRISKHEMVNLVGQVQEAMTKAADEGGNLDVVVTARWNANQQPNKDALKATVKHARETY
jgi:hypothetical protein